MTAFTYPDTARCNGFTCPGDRKTCRRFTERGLASAQTPWMLGNRAGDNGACTQHVGLVHAGQGIEHMNPAGALVEASPVA